MKLSELMEELQTLQNEDTDPEVHFSYDYGDRTHTTVAPHVREVSEGYVKQSTYHDMPAVVNEEDFDEDQLSMLDRVIIIG